MVGHRHARPTVGMRHLHVHPPLRGGILRRVVQQVADDLADGVSIGVDADVAVRERHREAVLGEPVAQRGDGVTHCGIEVERAARIAARPLPRAHKIQQVVHLADHFAVLVYDRLVGGLQLFRFRDLAGKKPFRLHAHDRERHLQLVREVVDERRLAFRFLARAPRRAHEQQAADQKDHEKKGHDAGTDGEQQTRVAPRQVVAQIHLKRSHLAAAEARPRHGDVQVAGDGSRPAARSRKARGADGVPPGIRGECRANCI